MMGGITNLFRRFAKGESGASMVEFTLMAPLLIALGLGAGEFGRAIQHYHAVTKGMRDAGRFLARTDVDCASAGVAGTIADANDLTRAKNLAITGYVGGGDPILSYWTDPSTITVTIDCYDNSTTSYYYQGQNNLPIPQIRVSAAVDYVDIGFLSFFGTGTVTFNISHQEMHIGE